MSCRDIRELLTHRHAGALAPSVLAGLDAHLAECAACARRAEVEGGFERALRRRLRRGAAPADLEARIRRAIREATAAPARSPWHRRPWGSALAAAAALAIVLGPALLGPGAAIGGRPIDRVMVVVDRACDRAGVPRELQRHCRHRGHVNALVGSTDGDYVAIDLDGAAGRRVLADPSLRGTSMRIEGRLLDDGASIRVERATPAVPLHDRTSLSRSPRAPVG